MVGQYGPRDRLLLGTGAPGSVLIIYAIVAQMLYLLRWLLAVRRIPFDRRGGWSRSLRRAITPARKKGDDCYK